MDLKSFINKNEGGEFVKEFVPATTIKKEIVVESVKVEKEEIVEIKIEELKESDELDVKIERIVDTKSELNFVGSFNYIPDPVEFNEGSIYKNLSEGVAYIRKGLLWEELVRDGKPGRDAARAGGSGVGVTEVKKIIEDVRGGKAYMTGTLSSILSASNVAPHTVASPQDTTGTFLEMGTDGKWVGTLGSLPKPTADALYASGALANLAAGATYRNTIGTQYTYGGAGVGWGAAPYYDASGVSRPAPRLPMLSPFRDSSLNTAFVTAMEDAGTFTIACVGESTTMGTNAGGDGSGMSYVGSWPWYLAQSLRRLGVQVSESSCFSSNDVARCVYSGFSALNVGYGHRDSSALLSSTIGSTIIVSPNLEYEWDSCKITYYKSTTRTGTADVGATGGATSSISGNGAVNGYASVIVTAAKASRDNQIFVNVTGAGGVVVNTYECYNSKTGARIRVLNCGASSSGVVDWSKTQSSVFGTALVTFETPNLTMVCLGGNDSTNSMAVETYIASYTTIISRLSASSGIVAMLPITPRKANPAKILVDSYVTAQSTLVGGNVIDYGAKVWGQWRDVSLPTWDNNVHLVSIGYKYVSDIIEDAICN